MAMQKPEALVMSYIAGLLEIITSEWDCKGSDLRDAKTWLEAPELPAFPLRYLRVHPGLFSPPPSGRKWERLTDRLQEKKYLRPLLSG